MFTHVRDLWRDLARCGRKRIWLDPNEMSEIQMANSRCDVDMIKLNWPSEIYYMIFIAVIAWNWLIKSCWSDSGQFQILYAQIYIALVLYSRSSEPKLHTLHEYYIYISPPHFSFAQTRKLEKWNEGSTCASWSRTVSTASWQVAAKWRSLSWWLQGDCGRGCRVASQPR